ncbi:MAG: type-F conjugative transfer system protein TraW [Pseudomonadota bacterium]|jgi:conjugal transfer pilus assembly protein TraW
MPCRPFISIALFLLAASPHAEDLGTIGPTYEITERDLIDAIQDKLRRMERTGELARMQDDYKRQVVDAIEHPKPVPGIAAAQTARTFYFNPTWTLDRNVVDEQGNVLYPAGTRVNPFDFDRLSKTLLFFDARDKKQVAFAKRFMAESKLPVKPILIAGAPLKLMREWKREVFYDQGGALSKRLSIAQSPAVVTQEGKRLRVDEIRL